MNYKSICLLALTVALGRTPMTTCHADDLAEKGRDIFQKYQSAVVTVQLVVKSKMSMAGLGGQDNEAKQDVTGTVVDPSGLTVLSLSATDPDSMLQDLMAGLSEKLDEAKFKVESELTDVKILLADGTEVPAEVVLRDKDLDLAFIRPKTKLSAPMKAVDLSQSARVQVLDQVITLNRLGQVASRAYAASVERISAVVQKPRTFYIPDSSMTSTTVGSPAFSLDGKVVGIFVMRSIKSSRGGAGLAAMFSSRPDNFITILIPAEDVLKGARQAPQAKEEKK